MRLISNILSARRRKVLAVAGFSLAFLHPVQAQEQQNRILPADSYQVRIDAITPPVMTLDGTDVQLAAGSLIFTGDGRTITSANLVAGTLVRVEFNFSCQVKKVWVLNNDEVIPRPWYMSLIRPSFVPPC